MTDKKKAGKKKTGPAQLPPPPNSTEALDAPAGRLSSLIVRGSKLSAQVQEAVTSATLSWSTTEVTQLSLTLADPGFELWRDAVFAKGSKIIFRQAGLPDLTLRVAALNLDGGPAGTGGFQVQARSWGVHKLKQRRGPHMLRNVSPTEYVRSECRKAGLKFVGQPTAKRGQVSRDTAKKGQSTQGSGRPSSWTTFQRLAQEVGFYCFEFSDTIYFGKPTWLINRTKASATQVALPLPGAPEAWVAGAMPAIALSEDAEVAVEVSGISLPLARYKDCRPGQALRLRGLPPFNDHYLTTAMTANLLGVGTLDLTAATPVNPKPQPPQKKSKGGGSKGGYDDEEGGGSSSGGATQTGSKSALDFVTMALTAVGTRYVFGAEASPSDPSPAALDCSELIEWACARVGVRFVDGSANQIAASKQIGVAQALRTRGAILYKPGHIGISMGDGRRSLEARNPRDGTGVFNASDIAWTAGGLIPGLRYG